MVRSLPYGEADVIVTFFSELLGVVPALAKSARAYRRGAPVVLEPMHTLAVELAEFQGSELLSVRSVSVATARLRVAGQLVRLEAAGKALRWLRGVLPQRTPEPQTWIEINYLLDALEAPQVTPCAAVLVAEFGIRLLGDLGYAVELSRCLGCGRVCEAQRSAYFNPIRGGIVCRRCGGGSLVLSGALRGRLAEAAQGGRGILEESDSALALELVESTLRAHVDGFESLSRTKASSPARR